MAGIQTGYGRLTQVACDAADNPPTLYALICKHACVPDPTMDCTVAEESCTAGAWGLQSVPPLTKVFTRFVAVPDVAPR